MVVLLFVVEDDFWVFVDCVWLCQILVNLLSNVVKYNWLGGSVVLIWWVVEDCCEILIIDIGQGIVVDQFSSLFELFNCFGVELLKVEGIGIGLVFLW